MGNLYEKIQGIYFTPEEIQRNMEFTDECLAEIKKGQDLMRRLGEKYNVHRHTPYQYETTIEVP